MKEMAKRCYVCDEVVDEKAKGLRVYAVGVDGVVHRECLLRVTANYLPFMGNGLVATKDQMRQEKESMAHAEKEANARLDAMRKLAEKEAKDKKGGK